ELNRQPTTTPRKNDERSHKMHREQLAARSGLRPNKPTVSSESRPVEVQRRPVILLLVLGTGAPQGVREFESRPFSARPGRQTAFASFPRVSVCLDNSGGVSWAFHTAWTTRPR